MVIVSRDPVPALFFRTGTRSLATALIIITRIIKNISNKMKEDVGMSKPKKDANKVRWGPNLNKPLPYNPT